MGLRDSARRFTYAPTSAMGQNLAIRHLAEVIYFEILSITAREERGEAWAGFTAASRVVVTYGEGTL